MCTNLGVLMRTLTCVLIWESSWEHQHVYWPGSPHENTDMCTDLGVLMRTLTCVLTWESSWEHQHVYWPGSPHENTDTVDRLAIAWTLCLHRRVVGLHRKHRDVSGTYDEVTIVQNNVELCLGSAVRYALDVDVGARCRWECKHLCVVL